MSAKFSKDICGRGKGCIDSKFPAMQHAKKIVSDSPGLVNFAFGLVKFVLNLPDGQVNFWEKFKVQNDCNQSC